MSAFAKPRASVATSSAASEYYDPRNPTEYDEEPSPVYERIPGAFPKPVLANGKGGYTMDHPPYTPPYTADPKNVGFGRSGSLFHRKAASVASGHTSVTSAAASIRSGTGSVTTVGPRATQALDSMSIASSRYTGSDSDTILALNNQSKLKRGGTWAHGPGTSGREEESLMRGHTLAERATAASRQMNEMDRMALSKAEFKDAERLAKIIKAEGKAEDKALKSGLKELDKLQQAQKKASAKEAEAVAAHGRAAKEENSASRAYLEAKARYERAQANLKVTEERMELARVQAEKTTLMVRRQAEEVEALRERKATDDRERAVKLANLRGGMISPNEY